LTVGLSAVGAEAVVPKLAQYLYCKDAKDLTADEKSMISAITGLVASGVGPTTGDVSSTVQSGQVAQVAVEDNSLITTKNDGKVKYYTKEDDKYNLLQYLVATNQLTSDQVPDSIFKDLANTDVSFTLDGKEISTR
jgi:hypothetical protein